MDGEEEKAVRKRRRVGDQAQSGPGAGVAVQRKRLPNRFYWDDEMHTKFVLAIFRLGLSRVSAVEVCRVTEVLNPEQCLSIEGTQATLELLRSHVAEVERLIRFCLSSARAKATSLLTVSERKGGNPFFHMYPLIASARTDRFHVGESQPGATAMMVAVVFNIGIRRVQPKQIFLGMEPTPPEMTCVSVKSHLQKYRNNVRHTMEIFFAEHNKRLNGIDASETKERLELAGGIVNGIATESRSTTSVVPGASFLTSSTESPAASPAASPALAASSAAAAVEPPALELSEYDHVSHQDGATTPSFAPALSLPALGLPAPSLPTLGLPPLGPWMLSMLPTAQAAFPFHGDHSLLGAPPQAGEVPTPFSLPMSATMASIAAARIAMLSSPQVQLQAQLEAQIQAHLHRAQIQAQYEAHLRQVKERARSAGWSPTNSLSGREDMLAAASSAAYGRASFLPVSPTRKRLKSNKASQDSCDTNKVSRVVPRSQVPAPGPGQAEGGDGFAGAVAFAKGLAANRFQRFHSSSTTSNSSGGSSISTFRTLADLAQDSARRKPSVESVLAADDAPCSANKAGADPVEDEDGATSSPGTTPPS